MSRNWYSSEHNSKLEQDIELTHSSMLMLNVKPAGDTFNLSKGIEIAVLLYYGGPFRYTPGLYEDLNLSQD